MKLIASSDYEVIDRNPLTLKAGELVKVGRRDEGWEGWVWVSTEEGRGSYVPQELLVNPTAVIGDMVAVVEDFTAKDLSVKMGEEVESLDEVKGWLWCRNHTGAEGWLPAYLLRKLDIVDSID